MLTTLLSLSLLASSPTVDRLLEGNRAYAKETHEAMEEQHPAAVVLCCSDSRVPPEIIFGQGQGDLFVVRVAGNVAGPSEIDSIIYGVKVLGAKVLIVLGHQNCGAIKAILGGGELEIELSHLVPYLKGAIEMSDDRTVKGVTQANVQQQISFIKVNPVLAPLVKAGTLEIVGAYFDLETGKVQLLK